MAGQLYGVGSNVQVGILPETVGGTFETGTPFEDLTNNVVVPTFISNIISESSVSGRATVLDATTVLTAVDFATPMVAKFNDNRTPIAASLRNAAIPASKSFVGVSNVNFLVAGTLLGGGTGPQITAPTGSFDPFINHDGFTGITNPRGGGEQFIIHASGSASAQNNRYRRALAIWDDTVTAHIDLMPGYVGGTVGGFGEPIAGTTLESVTLRMGVAMRDKAVDPTCYSMLLFYSDVGQYQGFAGLSASDLALNWDGRNQVEVGVTWVGLVPLALVSTDPSGSGFNDSNLYPPMLNSASVLKTFAVVTSTKPTVLSALSLTGTSWTKAGNVSGMDDVSGADNRTGVVKGQHVLTGSFDWHLTDDATPRELVAMAAPGTREKSDAVAIFEDAQVNSIIWSALKNEWTPTGPIPSAQSATPVDGQSAFTASEFNRQAGQILYQELPTLTP
jgi:hypothetical protein